MNVSSIKKLVDTYSTHDLLKAEEDLLEGKDLAIEIEGSDEGEKLTHILAAVYCIEEMRRSNLDINQALRSYSKRVRDSIN